MNYRENDKFIDGFPETCGVNGFSVSEWQHAWQIDLKSMADCLVANSRRQAETGGTQPGREGYAECPAECSIIVPVFNDGASLPTLHLRLTAMLRRLAIPYEILYVDP